MTTRNVCVAVVLVLLLVRVSAAQTTGQIDGIVVDQGGVALPGVTIDATSPALQGEKLTVTDADGVFHLLFLPPGTYAVRYSLYGFTTVEGGGIVVPLGRTVSLRVLMQSAFQEALAVTGVPPAIDSRSTEIGANLTNPFFTSLPIQRDYTSVALLTPGTTSDGSGVRTGPCG